MGPAGGGVPASAAQARPGGKIGRFEVLEVLGSGAMGVVLLARDPTLDRRVAIKLLKPDAYGRNDERAKDGLVREARTVAKLDHPNVVTVYEAGLAGDQVFVAMQFVEGGTLREWIGEKRRSWRVLLDVYLAAGRGLAAAHAAGLVHRDFKPDNVLIATDGRVFVSDFGLAGRAATPATDLEVTHSDRPDPHTATDPSQLQATQTRTGSILGTPAYMAPEVWEGAELDPLSDQFAFCIALWEAVYGERPFRADTLAGLAARVGKGELPPAPPGTEVPSWLRDILVKGLASDRTNRFASMQALLRRLGKGDPSAKLKRRIGAGAAVVLLGGAVGLGVVGISDATDDPCSSGEKRVTVVWNEGRRNRIAGAFEQTGLGYAGDTLQRTTDLLDNYADTWAEVHRDTCEATHVRNEQSPAVLDMRMRCLDERLAKLSALVAQLERADEDVVNRAVPAADGLATLTECGDVEALSAVVPPPADPETREQVERLRARLAEAESLEQLGHYAEGLEATTAITADAKKIDYPLVLAEALEMHGKLLLRSGKAADGEAALRQALELTAEAGDARLEARVWDRLLFAVGYLQTRHEEASHLFPAAETAVKRAKDEDLRGRLAMTIGTVLSVKGQDPNARKKLEEAIEILESVHGPDAFITAVAHNTHGTILHNVGELDAAAAAYGQAIASFESSVGPNHPHIAAARNNLAILEQNRADFTAARASFEAALEVWRAAHGEKHPNVATGYENLGGLEYVQGNYDAASELYEKAFALRKELLPEGDLLLASSHYNLATVAMNRGELQAGLEHATKAYEIREKLLGPEHPEVAAAAEVLAIMQRAMGNDEDAAETFQAIIAANTATYGDGHPLVARGLSNLGDTLIALERFEEAKTAFERALAIEEATYGPEHPGLGYALTGLGQCELEAGRTDAALELLDRAMKLRNNEQTAPIERGHTRFVFARAAWQSGRRGEAKEAARAALDDFEGLAGYGNQADEIRAWLAAH